jgi:predicted glutamine amidotransferase
MCGIVGIVSNLPLTVKEKTVFKWLSYFDYTRGKHSTGYITGDQNQNITMLKRQGSPQQLWEDPNVRSLITPEGMFLASDLKFIVGHNRAATRGLINTKNAHPFMTKHITGVHNGTVAMGLEKLPSFKEFEVDSEAVFNAIAENWTVEKLEQELVVSFSLVWHNAEKNSLSIVRNSQRPMYTATRSDSQGLVFASEDWMIDIALDIAGESDKYEEAQKLPELELWEFDLLAKDVVGSLCKTEIARKPFKKPYESLTKEDDSEAKHSYLGSYYSDIWFYPKKAFNQKEFERISKYGCSMCASPIPFVDYSENNVRFLYDESNPVCADCVTTTELEGVV